MSRSPGAMRGGARAGALAALALLAAGTGTGAAEVSPPTRPPVDPAARPPPPASPGRIRLASVNLAWFTGKPGVGFVPRTAADHRRVGRILRGTHAHLICLQEIIDVEGLEVLTREMNRLARGRAEYVFRDDAGDEILSPPDPDRPISQRIGLIYDRKTLRVREAGFLEELTGSKRIVRAPLLARVAVRRASLDFDFVGLHLKSGMLRRWARDYRTREVEILGDWIENGREGRDPDLVIMGDFNSPRDDETLALLDGWADEGKLVAIEDHLAGGPVGTHIPWEVGIDRGFMTQALWMKAGLRGGAAIFRFDDFMPGAHEVEDFCIRGRGRVRSKKRRCDCGDEAGGGGGDDAEWGAACGGDALRWSKAANYVRVSDHRPLLWDLRVPGSR